MEDGCKFAVVDNCDNVLFFIDHKPTAEELLQLLGVRVVKKEMIKNADTMRD